MQGIIFQYLYVYFSEALSFSIEYTLSCIIAICLQFGAYCFALSIIFNIHVNSGFQRSQTMEHFRRHSAAFVIWGILRGLRGFQVSSRGSQGRFKGYQGRCRGYQEISRSQGYIEGFQGLPVGLWGPSWSLRGSKGFQRVPREFRGSRGAPWDCRDLRDISGGLRSVPEMFQGHLSGMYREFSGCFRGSYGA